MSLPDIKLYAANFLTLGVTMTEIEVRLKILLLLITIGYTLARWINIKK